MGTEPAPAESRGPANTMKQASPGFGAPALSGATHPASGCLTSHPRMRSEARPTEPYWLSEPWVSCEPDLGGEFVAKAT